LGEAWLAADSTAGAAREEAKLRLVIDRYCIACGDASRIRVRQAVLSEHYVSVSEPFDQQFKLLSDEDPRGTLFLLSDIGLDEDVEIEVIDRELNMPTRRIDHAYLVKRQGQAEIHHFEATTRYALVDLDKMLDYGSLLDLKYRLPIYTRIVVLLERGMPKQIPQRYERRSGGHIRSMDLQIIKPWEIPPRKALVAGHPALLPWVTLLATSEAEQEEALRRLAATRNRDMALRMALLAGLRYGNKEKIIERFEQMLTEEILEESWYYHKLVDRATEKAMARGLAQGIEKGIEQGIEKGIEQGIEKGVERGQLEGERKILKRLLMARFGAIPDWAEQKLAAAPSDTLEIWSERILTATSLEEVLA
jgi:predicted transposase YdaD